MARRNDDRSLHPGTILLEKYRVVRVLGEGGMGRVLEAEHVRTGRRVAVKLLNPTGDLRAATVTQRFVNEARAAARLAHPNSVDVLDFESDDRGTLFLVQELLHGETLYDRLLREPRIPWREAIALMLPVMSALAEAHRKGIVHRDVKPENIFLSKAAPGVLVPKIIDFGIARLVETNLRLTHNDRVMGTPYYMSPEQAMGERELDGQTDVWAVGVVLYECIAGRLPFDGKDLAAVMQAILEAPLVPLGEHDPTLPAGVSAAIERALARDRGQRYATMQHFLDTLIGCVGETCVGVGRIRASMAVEGDVDERSREDAADERAPSLVPAVSNSVPSLQRPWGVRVAPWLPLALLSTLFLGVASGAFLMSRLRPWRGVAEASSRSVGSSLRCASLPPAPPTSTVVSEIGAPAMASTTVRTPTAPSGVGGVETGVSNILTKGVSPRRVLRVRTASRRRR